MKDEKIREILRELFNQAQEFEHDAQYGEAENSEEMITKALSQLNILNEHQCKTCKEEKLNTVYKYFKKYNRGVEKPRIDKKKLEKIIEQYFHRKDVIQESKIKDDCFVCGLPLDEKKWAKQRKLLVHAIALKAEEWLR